METKFITHIGTDESGKGDFFGPLVVAGVMVDEESAKRFKDGKECLLVHSAQTEADHGLMEQ